MYKYYLFYLNQWFKPFCVNRLILEFMVGTKHLT